MGEKEGRENRKEYENRIEGGSEVRQGYAE